MYDIICTKTFIKEILHQKLVAQLWNDKNKYNTWFSKLDRLKYLKELQGGLD